MRKNLKGLLIVLILCLMLDAQSQVKNYSESIAYSPREVGEEKAKSKKSKIKNSKQSEKADHALQKTVEENNVIRIPVSVFDSRNQFVKGLETADFKVFVNDQEQKIASFSSEIQPLNLVLVLDTSPALAYKIEDIKKFALNLAAGLEPQDNIQIIEFNGKVKVLTELTNDRQVISQSIKKLKIGDGTSLYDAVQSIFQNQVKSMTGNKTVILLTDAADTTSSKADYENSLMEVEKNDAIVFPFYLDNYGADSKMVDVIISAPNQPIRTSKQSLLTKAEYETSRQYLIDLASLSGGSAIEVKKLENLTAVELGGILVFLKFQYFITIDLKNINDLPLRGKIKVRVNRPNLTVKSRGSYVIDNER